jgi:uncharacterized protein (DUF1697 family)
MTAMVALLRGINVGGKGKLPMAQLREMVEGCGFTDVSTYIQSGNVVFRSPDADTDAAAAAVAAAVAAGSDVTTTVVVRTAGELASVVADNPFLARGEDPAQLHVVFLGPDDEPPLPDDPSALAPDEAVPVGSEVHLFLPNGAGRSKLAAKVGRVGTTRNWRTTLTLLDMARALDEGT